MNLTLPPLVIKFSPKNFDVIPYLSKVPIPSNLKILFDKSSILKSIGIKPASLTSILKKISGNDSALII